MKMNISHFKYNSITSNQIVFFVIRLFLPRNHIDFPCNYFKAASVIRLFFW